MRRTRKALAIQQKLVDVNPSVTSFQNALAWSHKSIGGLLRDTGKPAAALESFGKALAIQQKLVKVPNPSVTGFQSGASRNSCSAPDSSSHGSVG